MQSLQQKVAFITGGASGIGLGIAKVLAKSGASVVLADLRDDHRETALQWFQQNGLSDRVLAVSVDVSDRTSLQHAADTAEAHFGKIHIVINNAGIDVSGPLKEATFDDWDFGLSVNLHGVINGVQILLPKILKHGEGGHIVNTASLAGLTPMPSQYVIYATTKAAVIALSESIREGLHEDNIGVSVLCPGPIKSNIHQSGRNRPDKYKANSGFAQSEAQLEKRQVSDLWMDAETVGEMVRDGILNNQLYVITHGEWRAPIAQRFDDILKAMPEDVNADLLASLRPPED